jgi:ABC-type transporter Mla MlaB component
MALQITNNSGIFEINGDLNSQNVFSLNNHFNALLDGSKMITVSLNKINSIDKMAVNAIANLYKTALVSNKIFYIIGQNNEKVNQQFQAEKLNYILHSNIQ